MSVVRGWVECSGPFSCSGLSGALGLGISRREPSPWADSRMKGSYYGAASLRGLRKRSFATGAFLARIHRATLGRLRREIEPVSPAEFVGFLFQWQHMEPIAKLHGEDGLLDNIEMLQGFEVAAGALESEVLAPRMADYKPAYLDHLCLSGEVVWGRLSGPRDDKSLSTAKGALTRATPISIALRESLEWLLEQHDNGNSCLPGGPQEMLDILSRRGASFLSEIIASGDRLPSHVEEAMWQLAALGRVTADGMEPLRSRIRVSSRVNGNAGRGHKASRLRRTGRQRRSGYSRWSLLEAMNPASDSVEPWVRQLLRRYGVLFPELLAREPAALRWRDLVRVLRQLESRGEIRGGRFVSGFVGEQFALPEAVEALRARRNRSSPGQCLVVSACDPLNLVGILTPGEKVPSVLGNRVAFKDGVPMCSLENGNVVDRVRGDEPVLAEARRLLRRSPGAEFPEAHLTAVPTTA